MVDYDEQQRYCDAPRPLMIACNLVPSQTCVPVAVSQKRAWESPIIGDNHRAWAQYSLAILRAAEPA